MKGLGINDPIVISHDASLDEQYRELSPWLSRRLRHRLGSQCDVDDLVQESFIRFGRYDRQSRSRHPRALLIRIAGNLVTDEQRRARARGIDCQEALEEQVLGPRLLTAADQEATLALKRAILNLPADIREVFILARFSPMTQVEIGQALRISVKTVEWRLAKAVRMCLDELGR